MLKVNKLSQEMWMTILSDFLHWDSIRATWRTLGVSKNTGANLLAHVGAVCRVNRAKDSHNAWIRFWGAGRRSLAHEMRRPLADFDNCFPNAPPISSSTESIPPPPSARLTSLFQRTQQPPP